MQTSLAAARVVCDQATGPLGHHDADATLRHARVWCRSSRLVAALVPGLKLLAEALHVPSFANGRSRRRLRCCAQFQRHSLDNTQQPARCWATHRAVSFPHPVHFRFVHLPWPLRVP
jgi:hypothetical protein